MPPRRLDRAGAATLLGLSEGTVRDYTTKGHANGTGPPFPQPDGEGKYYRAELVEWKKARPGQGAAGTSKPRLGNPCEVCGDVVTHRWRDPGTGLLMCKPDYQQAGQAS